ncbi:piggyBac transposable element-derived protein 4-like [Xyrichtys novacula]|uniref:PiggyBac transposable element-derived protein 4-like n=1 Tax=Xyrichtys novacula TaxID=13765 RepID=A0AAV1GFU4_XYRNO|nr:piggyBac transposable element-derived protein 4-like [Xyrichtys novacula]
MRRYFTCSKALEMVMQPDSSIKLQDSSDSLPDTITSESDPDCVSVPIILYHLPLRIPYRRTWIWVGWEESPNVVSHLHIDLTLQPGGQRVDTRTSTLCYCVGSTTWDLPSTCFS